MPTVSFQLVFHTSLKKGGRFCRAENRFRSDWVVELSDEGESFKLYDGMFISVINLLVKKFDSRVSHKVWNRVYYGVF